MFVSECTNKKNKIKKNKIKIPLIVLTPPHCCACPKPGHRFTTSYVVDFFVLSEFSEDER
jgi:hypothetical protein